MMTPEERMHTIVWLRAEADKLEAIGRTKGHKIFFERAAALRQMAERLVERVKEVEEEGARHAVPVLRGDRERRRGYVH